MSFWTDIRDTVESAAAVVGDYLLPGSSLITNNLVSKGAQEQLNSPIGKLAQIGSSVYGGLNGNLNNYSTLYDKAMNGVGSITNSLGFGGSNSSEIASALMKANPELSAAQAQAAADAYASAGYTASSLTGAANAAGGGLSGLGKALIQGGLTLAGGYSQEQAAKDAANSAVDASKYATNMQRQMYDQSRADQAPWMTAGVNSLAKLSKGLPDWNKTPGYDFRLSEGQKAIDRSAAARGGLQSGAALKAAARYGQDYATNEYDNEWRRQATLAGYGQNATNQNQQSNSSYGNNLASISMLTGDAIGNSMLTGANARASMYKGLGNVLGNYWS